MSNARQIYQIPAAGAISFDDQFLLWQAGRTRSADVGDLLTFLQVGLRGPAGPQGDPGPKGEPGASVIVGPGGSVDANSLIFSTRPDGDNGGHAANTNWVNKKLGQDVGINWGVNEERLLVYKSHTATRTGVQPIFDLQVNTAPGVLYDSGTGLPSDNNPVGGGGISSLTRAVAGTRYGQFAMQSTIENSSTLSEGNQPFFGHVAFAPYVFQDVWAACPSWAIAAQMSERHLQQNPPNAGLVAELAFFSGGTDNAGKRTNLFIVANREVGTEGFGLNEITNAILFNTVDSKFKNGLAFRGNYDQVVNAQGVNAQTLIYATGNFSKPAVDLHALSSTGNGAAIAMNAVHNIQWQDANGNAQSSVGYREDTFALTGVRFEANTGSASGYINVWINGARKQIQLTNPVGG